MQPENTIARAAMLGALLLAACSVNPGNDGLSFGNTETDASGAGASSDGATDEWPPEDGGATDAAGDGGPGPTGDDGDTGDSGTGGTDTDDGGGTGTGGGGTSDPEPVCGNGTPEGDEECDDGNDSNEDACLNDCVDASCGDGYVWDGEETCDDGTNDGSYGGCESDCQALSAHCGDGTIDEGEGELCDDGNGEDADGCTTTCEYTDGFKVVFVTSQGHSANFGGLGGADATCQALADAASLPGTYVAWLSDATTSPASRFTQASAPYILRDGTRVADNWADLIDGTLEHAIDLTEQLGAPPEFVSTCSGVAVPSVWTNTVHSGASQGPSTNCEGWTSTTGTTYSGLADALDSTWSNACADLPCSAYANLYCFQQ
jgi:cysteine-rich repeat protein